MASNGAATSAETSQRFGMVIDVNRCVGCQTCTIACKTTNDTVPGVQWRKVLDVESGAFPDVERLFLVVGCQHCAEPPCVPVCPTGATFQRDDGLVAMDYDVCIGCAYCAVSCPYQARTIAHHRDSYYDEDTIQERATAHDDRLGVAQKCSFCVEKIDEAKERGLTPGVDLDVTPACAASCISQAIQFGDFNDADSNVSQLVANNAHFQMHAELGTDPQIKYLYETPAVPGRDLDSADNGDVPLSDPENALVGKRQTLWDFRAAMNWCFGGMSSGLAIMAWLGSLAGYVPGPAVPLLQAAAALLMAVGLFFVFLKLGRKLRALNALRRPGTSWMSRELYTVPVFYGAVLASLLWPHPAFHALAGLAALAFLVCQAKILHMAKGIPAWRVPLIPWMIVATGLFEGMGLLQLSALAWDASLEGVTVGFGVLALLAAINAALWMRYVGRAEANGLPPLTRRVLNRMTPWLRGLGQVLPFLLGAFAFIVGASIDSGNILPTSGQTAAGMVGMLAAAPLAVLGGFFWKMMVITRACHQQGFALAKMPRRGSGTRAAPRLTEPTPRAAAAMAGAAAE